MAANASAVLAEPDGGENASDTVLIGLLQLSLGNAECMFQKFWDGDVSERLDTRAASSDLTKMVDVECQILDDGASHTSPM